VLDALIVATALLGAGWASAQTQAEPGIRGQNIFEVKPDASQDPGFLEQTNGERQRVMPGNNAPMWRDVRGGVTGFSSLPVEQAPEAGNLIQGFAQYPGSLYVTAGEAWRQTRNNVIIPYGAALLCVALLAIVLHYFVRGPVGLRGKETGRRIERFTPFERSTHWLNATAFIVLAVSGLVMAFGRFFLLPVIGGALFGWLAYALKTVHNFVGPLFVVTTVFMIVAFVRDNLPRRGDMAWLARVGGLFGSKEPPSHRFNAGEKVLFWGGVLLLGGCVIGSGLFLDKLLPGFAYTRGQMQIAHMIHAVAALLLIALVLGHIYLGTLGMRGAYAAMREGYVDETWAREHHLFWYDDIAAGKIPAQRSAEARAAHAPIGGARVEGSPS
jgi:formate dehydrogenase subunit gamma